MTQANQKQPPQPPPIQSFLPPGVSWSAGEAASVNEFLNSDVGRKWLGILLIRKPKIDLSGSERAGLSGAFAAGYESFFSEIAATRTGVRAPDSAGLRPIDMTKD
jgi:hypothetical protein